MEPILKYYTESDQNQFVLPDGTVLKNDLIDFYKVVDSLASRYGMGGCRSIEEFVDMVDKTDPMVLNYMMFAIQENNKSEIELDKEKIEESTSKRTFSSKYRPASSTPMTPVDGRKKMTEFLRHWGIKKEEIDKATADFDSRKIKLTDYSWLNGDNLTSMSNEEFKKLLSQMGEERKNMKTFTLTLDKVKM